MGSILLVNENWKEPEHGIDIFVETNDIHVSIILPLKGDEGILSHKLQANHLKEPQYHSNYAMIGWGHEGVYRNAQSWNDLTFKDAFSAATGTGNALLHIYYRNNPQPNHFRKKIRITHAQYLHILHNIAGYFQYDENGDLSIYTGYGSNNIFYRAKGQYHAFNTCNVWAGRILKKAGITIGFWTPFSQSIMHQF